MKMRMIFCNCLQVGVDRWSDRYYTKDIALSSVVADFVRKHNEDFVGVELLDEGDESRREALDPDEEADRIEAEYEREREATCKESLLVGNASAMREALEQIANMGEQIDNQLGSSEETVYAFRNERCIAHNISECARSALSALPRNCDRPECATTKSAQDTWRKEDGGKTAYYEWLLATSTKGEKANGKLRPLGIPTVKDRVVQMAVKLVVEPIFEADFHDCSFGFRPNRSAQDAAERIAERVKEGDAKVYDADLSSYFDTIPHDKLLAALEMRIADGSVLKLIRQWLKACAKEPNGVMKSPKGRGTPQGGVISPLLSNVYLHWFETIAGLTAKAMGQAMTIVRYADDFVLLAKRWRDGFLRKVEGILEERMGLTVNREKTKVLDLDAERSSLVFLGYEFRKARDRLFGTGGRYLHFGPSPKSVKRVCREVHELTHSRNVLLPVETVVERVNRLLKGWGAFYSVGYPSRAFRKVNHHVLKRMARFLNRKSQRRRRLKFADTYYGEMTHYGLYRLAWADVRRARI